MYITKGGKTFFPCKEQFHPLETFLENNWENFEIHIFILSIKFSEFSVREVSF